MHKYRKPLSFKREIDWEECSEIIKYLLIFALGFVSSSLLREILEYMNWADQLSIK